MKDQPENRSFEQIKKHPILNRVLQNMEKRLTESDTTTSHTAHNSHYSSLSKDDQGADGAE